MTLGNGARKNRAEQQTFDIFRWAGPQLTKEVDGIEKKLRKKTSPDLM